MDTPAFCLAAHRQVSPVRCLSEYFPLYLQQPAEGARDGGTTVFNSNLPFAFIGNGTLPGVPWFAVIALTVILISWFILKRTVLGTWIYAVGGNVEAGRLAGIKVTLVLLFVYSMSGLL